MKDFVDKKILEYVQNKTSDESKILNDLSRETHLKVLNPRMLSGHYQGRLLSLISKLIKPKSILEIGTYTGYWTLCLLEGLEKKGFIHTIDHNEELLNIQNKFFERAKVSNRIKQYTGDAKEIIKNLKVKFDLIFIDADKENYPLYYDLVFDKLKSGGIIIADNILWSGKILEKVEKDDYATQSIIKFNNKIKNDERVENIILPLRDGLNIIIKN